MQRSLAAAGLVLQVLPGTAAAQVRPCDGSEIRAYGAAATFRPSHYNKTHAVGQDLGERSWSVTLENRHLDSKAGDAASLWSRERRMTAHLRQNISPSVDISFEVSASRFSSIDPSAPVLSRKARSTALGVDATMELGRGLGLTTGWAQRGGWGANGSQDDVIRMVNGAQRAASDVHVGVTFPIGGSTASEGRGGRLGLQARDMRLPTGTGRGTAHGQDISLTFSSHF